MTLKKILRFFGLGYVIVNCFSIHHLVFKFLKISVLHFQALPDTYTKQNKYHSVVLQIRNNP